MRPNTALALFLLRATNLVLFWGGLHLLIGARGALISPAIPAGVLAVYLAASAAAARRQAPAGGMEAGLLFSDIVLIAWTANWARAWNVQLHLFFLVPVIAAALRSRRIYATGVTAAAVAAAAGPALAAPGSSAATPLLRGASLLLAAAAAGLLRTPPTGAEAANAHARARFERSILFNEFLNHILFQIREYLTSITTVTEHVALSAKEPSLKELAEKLRKGVAELNAKLGRMLDSVKANTTSRRSAVQINFRLDEILTEALANTRAVVDVAGVDVRMWCDPGIGRLEGDKVMVAAVISAVFTNALEALRAKESERTLTVSARKAETVAQIEIVDNAGGLSKKTRADMFTPLYTTKAERGNLGLGLSMSRRMLERTGGTVMMKSEGNRTIARIEVPFKPTLPRVRNAESSWAGRRRSL